MTNTSQPQGFIIPDDMTEKQVNELGESLAMSVINRLINNIPLPLPFPYTISQLSDALADMPLPVLIPHIDQAIKEEFDARCDAIPIKNNGSETMVLEMMYQGMLQVVKSQVLDVRDNPL